MIKEFHRPYRDLRFMSRLRNLHGPDGMATSIKFSGQLIGIPFLHI